MKKKKLNTPPERHYTFNVSFNFDMQFTFTDDDVQPAEEGGEGDVDPTDKALAALEKEILECLSQNYLIGNIEAYADFDSLIGIIEDGFDMTEIIRNEKNEKRLLHNKAVIKCGTKTSSYKRTKKEQAYHDFLNSIHSQGEVGTKTVKKLNKKGTKITKK